MNMKKILTGIMAVCIVTGSVSFGTYFPEADAVDFNINGFIDEMTSPDDIGVSYILTLYTNAGTVKLKTTMLTDNTLGIEGVQSLPSGMIDLVIPSEVDNLKISTILPKAFLNVKGIRSVELTEGISGIGKYAFAYCADIETIKLPSTITTMETSAFVAINNLKSITVASGGIPQTINGALCDGSNIYLYPTKKTDLSSYTVSSGIKNVQPYCFFFNRTLKKITLPQSVERIYPNAFVSTNNCTVVIMNKNCIFYDDGESTNPKFFDSTTTLCGYKGSTAETYAKENNLKFIDIESLSTTTTTTTKSTTTTTKPTTTKTTATTVKTTSQTTTKTTVPVTTTVSTGKFLLGDANCDGEVNIADATAITQHIGNKDKYGLSEQGLANADCCNVGDGVTGLDSLAIQKLEAKQITKLPDTVE